MELANINTDSQIYLIKTNNGKYYQSFLQGNYITYYQDEMWLTAKALFMSLSTLEAKTRYGKAVPALTRFYNIKPGDYILIVGRKKQMAIGIVENIATKISVKWVQEMLAPSFIWPYLYKHDVIVDLNSIKQQIFRLVHPLYFYEDYYHLTIKVKQGDDILLKSLVGMQNLVFNYTNGQDLTLKIHLESPGVIEFISKHWPEIQLLIKLIQLLINFRKAKKIEDQALYEAYLKYEIEKLEIDW